MRNILLSLIFILCVSSGLCLDPIPTDKGLIPADSIYSNTDPKYGILFESQLVEVTFVNPHTDAPGDRPMSARLSMRYNVTRKDDTTNKNTVLTVNKVDEESYLQLRKDQIDYMNGDAWKCNLNKDKLIYKLSELDGLCSYLKDRIKKYDVNQRIEYQYNSQTGIVKDNIKNIQFKVVEVEEAEELMDKYFNPLTHNIGDLCIEGTTSLTRNTMPLTRKLFLTNDRLYHYYEIQNNNKDILMKGYARYYITRSTEANFTYVAIDSVSTKYSLFEFPMGGSDKILLDGGCNGVQKDKQYTVEELAQPCNTIKTLVLGTDGFKYNTMFSSLDATSKVDIFEGLDVFQAYTVHISGTTNSSALVEEIRAFDDHYELEDDSGAFAFPIFLLVIMVIFMI